jgi:hypothetical protein
MLSLTEKTTGKRTKRTRTTTSRRRRRRKGWSSTRKWPTRKA